VQAAVGHNTARLGDFRVAVPVRRLTLVSSHVVHGYVSRGVASDRSSDSSLQAQLRVSGHFDLPCEGVSVRAMLGGTDFLAVNSSDSSGSVVLHPTVVRPPGLYTIVFSLTNNPTGIAPATLALEVRSCTQGEVSPRPDMCEVCGPGSFSLNPSNASCDACPDGALCPGGPRILAQPGHWHSAPQSTQMHRWAVGAGAGKRVCRHSRNDAQWSNTADARAADVGPWLMCACADGMQQQIANTGADSTPSVHCNKVCACGGRLQSEFCCSNDCVVLTGR
jgi:hypothetical protein